MKRTTLNLLIDSAAALLILAMIGTGYVLRFPLPPGTNKSLSLWGLTRHQWGEVHFWISTGLLSVLLVHLALHWQWVVSVVRGRLHLAAAKAGRHLVSAALTLLVVAVSLALLAWASHASVRERDTPCCPTSEAAGTPASGRREPSDSGSVPRVDFWKDVYPVLEGSCLSCHGPRRATGGFRIDRREDYFGKEGRPPLVVPGRGADSPLTAIVTGARKDVAAPERHRLPEAEAAVLKRWIDEGAEWPDRPGRR